MNSERLQYLFDSYHKSTCTKEELAELTDWYENLHTGGNIEDLINEAGSEQLLADQLYQSFSFKASEHRRHKSMTMCLSIAAAANSITDATFWKTAADFKLAANGSSRLVKKGIKYPNYP